MMNTPSPQQQAQQQQQRQKMMQTPQQQILAQQQLRQSATSGVLGQVISSISLTSFLISLNCFVPGSSLSSISLII